MHTLDGNCSTPVFKSYLYFRTAILPFQVETFSGEPVQLVKLRNPIGPGGEYVGAWAREALDWDEVPPQEKERLAVRHMGDGEFW